MSDPQMEEMAALRALGLLDDEAFASLRKEAAQDAELQRLIRSFDESAACLAFDAPQVEPPPSVRRELLRQLPEQRPSAKIISFAPWIPYALAACLMALAVYQANEVFTLSRQVGAEHSRFAALEQRNNMTEVRLASLEAKDAGYVSAKIMVAWDPATHNGVLSIQNLPPPPAGHDYQLWVLDPTAPGPISAGLIKTDSGMQGFAMQPRVRSEGPGFAISLEPAGGMPSPTGTILFAVAPGR